MTRGELVAVGLGAGVIVLVLVVALAARDERVRRIRFGVFWERDRDNGDDDRPTL